jgi:glycosyltransferase involved in cell wall biosynthesis
VYNAVGTLKDTIESVLAQERTDVEYVIVDGGSTDGTLDLIRRYDDALDYWMSGPDEGIYDAMNQGIAQCHGSVIGILNADDVYQVGALSRVSEAYDQDARKGVYHGDLIIEMEEFNPQRYSPPDPLTVRSFCRGMPVNHPATFVHRSAYEQHGLFDTDYDLAADAELMLRFLRAGVEFSYIPVVLTRMRAGGASMQRACEARKEVHEALLATNPPLRYQLSSYLDVLLKCTSTKLHRHLRRGSTTRSLLKAYRTLKQKWKGEGSVLASR